MTESVLCYAESLDNPDIDWIILVEKKQPPWQAGQFNLPGGAIMQNGESPEKAAARILKWAVGIDAEQDRCEILGTMHGVGHTTHVVRCPFSGPFNISYDGPERPLLTGLREALGIGMNLVQEMRVIIPLCIAEEHFQMIVSNDRSFFSYTLQVS